MRIHRRWLFGCIPFLILSIILLAWVGAEAYRLSRYNRRSRAICEKINVLHDRRPKTVAPKFWDECLAWACIAEGNICFSENHASYNAMCHFDEQLDEKLKGNVDLGTIEWIGERLAETGPHGQQYMAKWRKQWQDMQEQGKRDGLIKNK